MITRPHQSTGINVLEDLLKKIIPQIEDDYKMTTSEEQRESYRAHIIDAVVKTLTPLLNLTMMLVSNTAGLEEEIDVEISDMMVKMTCLLISVLIPKKQEEEEEEDPRDAFGIEGKDTTGRNMAYSNF